MSMKRRQEEQRSMWVATPQLPKSPGHVFYEKLNRVLDRGGFDRFVEDLCEPHYAGGQGRQSIRPGVYFRMLFVGYFEGIDSQRGIAWRCADSLSLRDFLGLEPTDRTPEHSSLTRIRQRLPEGVFDEVFAFVLKVAVEYGLLRGKTIAVDSTTLEANAAMKSLVRRDTGDDWKTYVRKLAAAEGIEDPNDEELRRFDKKRKKKTSNEEWQSKTDPDSRVAKMKDGRTHMAYKAEHALDLESDLVVAAPVYVGNLSDTKTLPATVERASEYLERAGSEKRVDEVVGDKGYHSAETLQTLREDHGVRPYIAEPKMKGRRHWASRPRGQQQEVYANRYRIRGERGRRLGRLRSERVERSFAHVCATGGGRRAWIRGRVEVAKSHLMRVAARNLGVILLALFGIGTPRTLQSGSGILEWTFISAYYAVLRSLRRTEAVLHAWLAAMVRFIAAVTCSALRPRNRGFSTGC
jgi:transposase